jgi:hypothetical protein
MHLFFRVDLIVYCEGGPPLSYADVVASQGADNTLDVAFWQRVVQLLGAKQTYHFKSVGSKTTLTALADDVRNHHLPSVIICFDRDYDWHCSRKQIDNFIAYTYGYSWESDVVTPATLESLFYSIVPPNASTRELFKIGMQKLANFERDLHQWCETEIALSFKHKGSVFPRPKPLAVVDLKGDWPHLDESKVRANLQALGYRRRPRSPVKLPPNDVLRHCWGKLTAAYAYHLLMVLVQRRDSKIKLSYDMFMRWITTEAFKRIEDGHDAGIASHYRSLAAVFP